MGSGDSEHMLAGKHLFGEPLRAGDVALAGVEDRFHQRIAPGDDISDHPDVGAKRELLGAEPLGELDAERAQLVAHRRIDVGIAAGDAIAGALAIAAIPPMNVPQMPRM